MLATVKFPTQNYNRLCYKQILDRHMIGQATEFLRKDSQNSA